MGGFILREINTLYNTPPAKQLSAANSFQVRTNVFWTPPQSIFKLNFDCKASNVLV